MSEFEISEPFQSFDPQMKDIEIHVAVYSWFQSPKIQLSESQKTEKSII